MEKENVIQKIQKLLKLQYGAESIGSTGEAYQAAKMVKKLLMEYNLSLGDIDVSDGKDSIHISKSAEITSGSMYGNHWKFQLLGVIAVNNLCQMYKRMSGKMFVVGTEENVAVVKVFFEYLSLVFRRLAEEHWLKELRNIERQYGPRLRTAETDKTTETVRRKYIRSYLEGVPYGLQQNYDSLKPTSAETAMVVCHQEAINDYMNNNFKCSESKSRKRTRRVYGDAFDLGVADGRVVSLNRQIVNKEGNLNFIGCEIDSVFYGSNGEKKKPDSV